MANNLVARRIPSLLIVWLVAVLPHATTANAGSDINNHHPPRLQPRKLVMGVDGGTESIRACLFDANNGRVVGQSCAAPYPTHHPQPGWAEQSPSDWYTCLGTAVRGVMASLPTLQQDKSQEFEVCAICLDTTCCSVVLLDDTYSPIRPALLWMDARSAPQTKEILETCQGDPALYVNCDGQGPLSAEWMTPKCLWVYQNEPSVWKEAKTICEYQDYLNYKLTGCMVASSCNAATRWHWNGDECIRQNTKPDSKHPGRPLSLYQKLGIPDLADKLPQRCIPMGDLVGELTAEAAQHLNLPNGLPVVQGGPDAFVGMVGLGCLHPGQLCLITGSSHLHCVVTSQPRTAPGTWGAYRGSPLPGMNFAEGGQSSTGSIVRWAKQILFAGDSDDTLSYKELDDAAVKVPPGCDGLVALETFQGSRTPITDPSARGALVGLTLSHTRAHIWRALMEGVCFGTRACIEGLAKAGHTADEIIIAGGATRSPLWLQMHADITGLPVVVCEHGDAPLLGAAVLASVGVGIHKDIESAVKAMVRQKETIRPDKDAKKKYSDLYQNVYSKLGEAVRPISHAIADLRGGAKHDLSSSLEKKSPIVVSPSLLACDWSNIRGEVQRCIQARALRLHVDIFDGVFLDSPYALTFGPQMVQAIKKSCDDALRENENKNKAVLDLHVCVDRPLRYVKPLAEMGGDRFIFQWEAMVPTATTSALEQAKSLAQAVLVSGMSCGVSINPSTELEAIFPLLETGLIDLVDILAVEPGFGGQAFQSQSLQKVKDLKQWRDNHEHKFDILVDGGINKHTAASVVEAGADILVAGTFLFKHPQGLLEGIREISQ